MAAEPTRDDPRAILDSLQAAVDARDADALIALFDQPAVLIGAGGDGRNPEALHRYLTAVATQPESLRWEWREIVPFEQSPATLGFAAFGELVISDAGGDRRAPFRLTLFAVKTPGGWRIRQFHGSVPADFGGTRAAAERGHPRDIR
jgi:ketosteroid isomerase-like protein